VNKLCLSLFKHDPGPLAPVLNEWVDERFGPIRFVMGMSAKAPEPQWWLYDCRLARSVGEYFSEADIIAMGASTNGSDALRRALGEAVERYNALNSMKFAELFYAPMDGNPIADMLPQCADFEPCSESLKHCPKDVPVGQVKVKRLSDNSELLMPAGFVHLNFACAEGEPLLTLPITSGLAFHTDLHTSIWSGLREYAERDAIMTCWWLQKKAPRILINENDVPNSLADRLIRLRNAGLQAFLFDVSTDFRVPCVFCVLRSDRAPYVTVGASCHQDIVEACVHALDECACLRIVQKESGKARIFPSLDQFDWVSSLVDRAELFAQWKGSPAFDFLIDGRGPTTTLEEMERQEWWHPPNNMEQLQVFATLMEKQDLVPFWADTTVDEVRELGYCVKVTVPQMIPLSPHHNVSWLGTRRLAKAAGKENISKDDINRYPHPFP